MLFQALSRGQRFYVGEVVGELVLIHGRLNVESGLDGCLDAQDTVQV